MRLSAKLIQNYSNINSFGYTNQWVIRAGEPNTLYFQLVDLEQNALRHIAGVGGSNQPYSVSVTFPSIDDAKVITATAVQADATDASVWKVSLGSNQTPGSGQVVFTVVEGSATRSFGVLQAIQVEYPGNDGCDGTIPNSNSTFF